MKNTKRALSLLLSLMLVLGAVAVGGMSASALAADAELRIGNDKAIFAGDIKKSEGTGWSITVNEDENSVTLNLDNLDLTYDGYIYAHYLDLTITGSANLTSTRTTSSAISIHEGNLTLNGDFTLRAQCETGPALNVNGNLTVEGGSLSVINTENNTAILVPGAMTVNGGSVYAKTESSSRKAISTGLGLTLNNNEAFAIGDRNAKEVLIKVPGQPPYITGDIIEYGTYPQSEVTDETILAALNEKISDDGWVSYGYYSGTGLEESMEPSDYMKYQDVVLEGVKYRAVMFTAYRPYLTYRPCSADNSYQDDNGYYVSGEGGANVYWFKFEPVEWRVLDPDTGLVLCNSIIDSQAFSNTVFFNGYDPFTDSDLTLFAGDFANSSIRQWLNDDFINTAFSPAQQENIVLSEQPAHYPTGEVDVLIRPNLTLTYTFEPTKEKVFLLTSKDSLNTEYGFSGESGDTALIMSGSDYAESQGLCSDNSYYTAWLTRTCFDGTPNSVYAFDSRGETVSVNIPGTSAGIVPAMHLTELVSDPTGAPAVIEIPEGIEDIYNNSEYTGVEAGEGYTLSGTVTATDAGNYTATATLEDGYIWSDGTYEDKEISWKIKPRLIWLTPEASLDNDTFVYDGTEKKPELAFLKDSYIDKELTEGVDYKIIHKEWRNNINASDPEEEDIEKLPTAVFAIEGMGNYYHSIDQYLVFRIEKADPEVTAPVPVEGLRADGTPKELVTAGSTTGGTLEYSLDGENYSTDLPKASEEGAYTVYYRVTGNENYNDAEPKTVSAAIGEGSKDEPAAKAEISIKGENSLTLSYRQNKTFTAEAAGIPEGGSVVWYLNGEKAGEGRTFRVENPEKDYTVQSKIVDKDGSTVAESETVKVTVKHGFFDKLKAWLTDLLLGVFAPLFSKFESVC